MADVERLDPMDVVRRCGAEPWLLLLLLLLLPPPLLLLREGGNCRATANLPGWCRVA